MASGVAQRAEAKQGDTLCSYRGFYYLNSDGFKNCYTNDIVSQAQFSRESKLTGLRAAEPRLDRTGAANLGGQLTRL